MLLTRVSSAALFSPPLNKKGNQMSDKFTCLNLSENSIVLKTLMTIEATEVLENIQSVLEKFKQLNPSIQTASDSQRASIANELLECGLGYIFDAAYCDENNIPFCENCVYEWGNHFWGAIATSSFVLGKSQDFHVLCENNFVLITWDDGFTKAYGMNTSQQKCPVNETVKRFIELDMKQTENSNITTEQAFV